MSTNRRRSVIDALDKTRQEHPHPTPPTTTANAPLPLSRVASKDVTDEILEQSEAVHLPKDESEKEENKEKLTSHSTTATHPGTTTTWQPLASKSSNQLPSSSVTTGHGYGAQDLHDKPSVLPEILPGFKDRMADIHHATLKSVSDVTPSHGPSSGEEGGKWTSGTMFPAMTPSTAGGFQNPFNTGSVSHQQQHGYNHTGSAEEEATRKIARSSILYESADLEESTTSLSDNDPHQSHPPSTTTTVYDPIGGTSTTTAATMYDPIGGTSTTAAATMYDPIGGTSTTTSSTLVQGGQGGRRWSHELSPEKAGLVGSVLSVAGLVKDVVLDKIQQRPPASSTARTHQQNPLTEADEKQVAAGVAFGGSEESGDQTILLDGLLHHRQQHEAERAAAAAVTTASNTPGVEAEELLKAAPAAGKEHQKSIFHLAANPETRKSMLLDHPESLGYHGTGGVGAKDQQSMGDSTSLAAALGVQHQRSAGAQDLSKTSR
ncbi:hypothetical protein BGZ96_006652 [Linnemannia gamsii]|uniref:Uncharacterized protein n=1 Tax=Linnemannia gamsii TaxID=64522 RepID=A0ABQ7K202_9FUNG|nr:hypothetical protein BGZ96_006652 [Linnemannia gamsii]